MKFPVTKTTKLQDFTAANSFLQHFVKRNGLESCYLHGKGGSVIDTPEIQLRLNELRKKMENYTSSTIFNVDETGLFYRTLPRRTYIMEGETKKEVRGTSDMSSKDRLTVIVCTNASGVKVPLAAIGKPKNPRIFRTVDKLPMKYYDQQRAWSTGEIFYKWFNEVFLVYIRKEFSYKKILLIMDNCGAHGQDLFHDPLGMVEVEFLPKNTTAKYQPMDAGIISCLKTQYKYNVLREILKYVSIDTNTEVSREPRTLPPQGYRGIQDGKKAMSLLNRPWNEISTRTIR